MQKAWLTKKHEWYLSSSNQNELLKVIALEILRSIAKDLQAT